MHQEMTSSAKNRTEKKLRYAEIHLTELKNYPNATSNDDWENAHYESCFFHLAGAVEAVLHEIKEGYSLNLKLQKVHWDAVEKQLQNSGTSSGSAE